MPAFAFVVALGLSAVHVFAGKLRFLDVAPRSIWLSAAGGVSVAYVFVHVLPDVAGAQRTFASAGPAWFTSLERHVWLLGLTGLTIFYGLERLVRQSRRRNAPFDERIPLGPRVFWLHIASFALYNLLFGYLLLHRQETGARSLALFGAAIGLHFMVNDFGLRSDHRQAYDRTARWVLAAAVLAGWLAGVVVPIRRLGIDALYALLAGGIILNVLKEELPAERESRFWAFAAGAAIYACVLLVAA